MKIRPKLTLYLLLISLIPLSIVAGFSILYVSQQIEDLTLQAAKERVETSSTELSGYFASRIAEVNAYAQMPLLTSMDWYPMREFLQQEVKRHKGIYEKFILGVPSAHFRNTKVGNPAQQGFASFNDKDPNAKLKSIRKRGYWQALVGTNLNDEQRSHVSNPMISYTTGVKQVVVGSSIISNDNKLVGMIGGGIPWVEIESRINLIQKKISIDYGDDVKLSLIDSDGIYIYHWDPENVVHLVQDENGNPLLDESGEKTVHLKNIKEHSSNELVKAGALLIAGESGLTYFTDLTMNEEFVVLYAPVRSSGYGLLIRFPKSVIIAPIKMLQINLIFIVLGVALFVLAVSLFSSKKFVERILILLHASRAISAGDYSQKLNLQSKDEIAELANGFNSMADSLRVREENLFKAKVLAEKNAVSLARAEEIEKHAEDLLHAKEQAENDSANLAIAKQAADEAVAAKTQFLSNMSHEIRTPVNGVIGMAQLLEDTPLNDEQKSYLASITQSGNSLLSVINDNLDFSKLDSDKFLFESIAFDLERVCQESIELVAVNFTEKNLEFILDFAPDCSRYFMGDPSRFRQILINLLGNAAKFTHRGFVRCGVSSENTDTGDEHIHFQIQDTGIGIKSEAIEHLFDEFTQADSSTTREYGGTGLGLAITKKLVLLMGGVIKLESVYDEGTTFHVHVNLPCAVSPEPLKSYPLKDVKLLFVDSLVENIRIFKRLFLQMGLDATVETKLFKTIPLLEIALENNEPFKIVVLTHNMMQQSGLELGRTIRKMPHLAQTKLLVLSSFGHKGDSDIFSRAGFNAYLSKLSRYETLQSILSKILVHNENEPIITRYSLEDTKASDSDEKIQINANVLLAEDVLPNQIIAKKFLNHMGVEVDVVNDGQKSVAAFREEKFDLIFMDCRMPVMDGYEACKAIRHLEKQRGVTVPIPIIALTANASNEDRLLCLDAGMNDVITKPFKRNDLEECLIQYLPDLCRYVEAKKSNSKVKNIDQTAVIEWSIYNQLNEDMGKDFQLMITSAQDSLLLYLDHLLESTEQTPLEDTIRFAHTLKSTAATIGALKLSQHAADLEKELRTWKVSNFEVSLEHLKHEYEEVIKTLTEL